MSNLKKQIIILYFVISLSFTYSMLSKSFNLEWTYDISVGVFTSSIVACFITLTQYNYEKNKVFEKIKLEVSNLTIEVAKLEKFNNLKSIDTVLTFFDKIFNLGSNIIECTKDLDFISPFKNKRFYNQFSKELFNFRLCRLSNYHIHYLMLKELVNQKEMDRMAILSEYERLKTISNSTKNAICNYLSLNDYDNLTLSKKTEYHYNEIMSILQNESFNEEPTLRTILNRMSIVLDLFERKSNASEKDIKKQIDTNNRIARKWDDMSEKIMRVVNKNVSDYQSYIKANDSNNS